MDCFFPLILWALFRVYYIGWLILPLNLLVYIFPIIPTNSKGERTTSISSFFLSLPDLFLVILCGFIFSAPLVSGLHNCSAFLLTQCHSICLYSMPGFKTFKQGQLLAKDKIRLRNKFNVWQASKIKLPLLFVPSETELNNKVLKVCLRQRKLSAAEMSGEVQGLQIWSNLQSCTLRLSPLVSLCLAQARYRQPQTDGDLELSDSLTQLHDCGLPHRLAHAQHPHFHGC